MNSKKSRKYLNRLAASGSLNDLNNIDYSKLGL